MLHKKIYTFEPSGAWKSDIKKFLLDWDLKYKISGI